MARYSAENGSVPTSQVTGREQTTRNEPYPYATAEAPQNRNRPDPWARRYTARAPRTNPARMPVREISHRSTDPTGPNRNELKAFP